MHGISPAEIEAAATRPVMVDGRPVTPTRVRVRAGREGRSIVDLTLVEGRHHIVRNWAEAIGAKVERLARMTYGPVRLGDLPVGRWRPLTPKEEQSIYTAIKMDPEGDAPPAPRSRKR